LARAVGDSDTRLTQIPGVGCCIKEEG